MSSRLKIIAFPCNQFKNQEPKSNGAILDALEERGIVPVFPLMGKVEVKGVSAHIKSGACRPTPQRPAGDFSFGSLPEVAGKGQTYSWYLRSLV